MDIQHFLPGEMMTKVISKFLSECRDRFPEEVGEVDLDAWPSKLATHADSFCVCRSDGSLSAALFAYLNFETRIGYIPFICALPENEKGTGYRLHEEYRHCAEQHDIAVLRLEVLKSNVHAYNFYKRQGYDIVEDRACRNRYLMEMSPIDKTHEYV